LNKKSAQKQKTSVTTASRKPLFHPKAYKQKRLKISNLKTQNVNCPAKIAGLFHGLEGQPTVFLQRAFWNKSKFAKLRTGATTFPFFKNSKHQQLIFWAHIAIIKI